MSLTSVSKIYGFPVDPIKDYDKISSFVKAEDHEWDEDFDDWVSLEDFEHFITTVGAKAKENGEPVVDYQICGLMGHPEAVLVVGIKSAFMNYMNVPFAVDEVSVNDELTVDEKSVVSELREKMGFMDNEGRIGWYLCVSAG